MHVINPIAFILCYIFFAKEHSRKIVGAITAPIMLIGYLLFDYIRYMFTGAFIYGFFEPEQFTNFHAIIIGAFMYVSACLLGMGLFAINQFAQQSTSYRFPVRL